MELAASLSAHVQLGPWEVHTHAHANTGLSVRTAAPADNQGGCKRCFLGAMTKIRVVQFALALLLLNNFDATNLLLFKDLPNVPLLKRKMLQW